jgi:hypothetical protein
VVAKLIGMKLLVTELPAFQELAAIQVPAGSCRLTSHCWRQAEYT